MSRFLVRNHLSFLIILVAFLGIVYLRFYFPIRNIISWDVFGYYLYLPAVFIHHDLALKDLGWVYHLIDQYHNTSTFYQAFPGPEGSVVLKYSCGMALMYSPFFFAAHILAPYLGYAADGLSMPYQYSMVIGGLIYSLIGMLLLRRLLLKFFGDALTAFILLLVIVGSNYYEMAYEGGLLTHNILFALYPLLLLYTMKWYNKPAKGTAFILGLIIGLITLIRPTDGLIIIIPLLWGIVDKESLKQRKQLLKSQYVSLIFFALGILIMGLPQIIYWKAVAGSFIYYSYINPGEGFDFLYPHTLKFLFSFRKGWLVYTPLMFFALAGLVIIWRKKKEMFWPLLAFLVIYIYVVSSWSCWYYAGSYGSRPMVQVYPLLAVPMGFMFQRVRVMKVKRSMIVYSVAMYLLMLNIFQMWQYSFGWVLDPSRMTAAYYFKVFGKTHINLNDRKLLLVERSAESVEHFTDSTGYQGRTLAYLDFENVDNDLKIKLVDSTAHSGKYCLSMDSTFIYSPGLTMPYKTLTHKDHNWLRVSVWVYSPLDPKVRAFEPEK